MSRAISPKLSIGSILNAAPPANDPLPPIKSLPAPAAPAAPTAMASPAIMPPLRQSSVPAIDRPELPSEHRDYYTQYKPYYQDDSYYGRPAGPVNPMYAAPCQDHVDVRAPVPVINGLVAPSYDPQPMYGYYPGQDTAYVNNVYYNYTQRPDAGIRYGQKSRRFRRRYYQIHRKYKCSFEGCTKSYGSLNHLNTHIVTKQHGQRKCKSDFRASEEEADRTTTDQSSSRSEDEKKDVEEEETSANEYGEQDTRYGEGKYGEGKYGEGKYGEGKYAEGKYGEGKYPEQKYPEQKYPEPQYPEQKYPEQKYPEPQYPEQKYPESAHYPESNHYPNSGTQFPDSATRFPEPSAPRFAMPTMHQTPKYYSLPLPPLYNSESCSVRLPSLPSIISQCSSS